MQKSIFRRYLTITMAIILLSFTMLGSMMMLFFSNYWRSEKKDLLTKNASSVSNMATRFLTEESGQYLLQTDVLKTVIATFSNSIDADIFITDLEGNIKVGIYSNSKQAGRQTVLQGAVDQAVKGLYEGRGDFGGMYERDFYVIGVPVLASGSMHSVGVVFAATSAGGVSAYLGEALNIFLLAAAGALAVTFCVVGAFAYRLVKPLRQMAAAARSFGTGDFSVRVPVTSADELGQLAMSFNHMANSLTNSEGMRRSFIANVSHELKTPMTTIAGFIDGILDGTIPPAEQRKYLGVASGEVKRLSRLVKSMLDLSRIDNGEMKIHPESFDLSHTLFTTLLTFEQKVEEKKIEIRGLDQIAPQTVLGDQDLLHQVLYNLLENAVKFTNEGGYIAFAISDGIDRTSVVIENSGPGIAPEDLPMVFDRFYKTDKSRSQDKNGMGLGLYLVRTILKLHGGDITVSSVAGSYCRFEFTIPKPQEAPKLKENQPGKLKEPSARRKELSFRKKDGKGKESPEQTSEETQPERQEQDEGSEEAGQRPEENSSGGRSEEKDE